MEWLLVILIAGSLFFTLMGNFKISRLEEHSQKQAEEAFTEREKWKNQWIEKDKAIHQTLNDIQHQLKESIEEFQTIAIQAIRKDIRSLEQVFARIQQQIESMKDHLQEETIPDQSSPVPEQPTELKPSFEEPAAPANRFLPSILERMRSFSSDEEHLMIKVFQTEASRWHRPSEAGISETTSKLIFPLLGRKLIINGVPIVKMKESGGFVKFLWGDGLADAEQESIAAYFADEVKE
jgi:hypothetical protein